MAYKIKKQKKKMYDERIRSSFEWNNPFAYTKKERERKRKFFEEMNN
jgi:hypothetical protein